MIENNIRKRTITVIIGALILLIGLLGTGLLIGKDSISIQPMMKNEAPTWGHLFGTDWLGRDMLLRTVKGLTLSFTVGIVAAFLSAVLALVLSMLCFWNRHVDRVIVWLVDLALSVPHLVTLILISFVLGGGFKGVVVGLALTHWPRLTRLLRAEILQINQQEYVSISRKLGKSRYWIAKYHFFPHLFPQLLVGFILLFPHAILHEAAITFLGFGLPAETPAIGIILSESMKYLTAGFWWLAFFPGLTLLFMVFIFDLLGRNVQKLMDPFHGQRG